jgi:hypothetical protein
MAYANLIAQSCNNPIETFMRFRDFICKRNGTYDYSSTGVGWTLHDSVYAIDEDTISINDYFVIYSAGEDGQRDIYFKITYVSGYISIQGYLYWNNTTHAGVFVFGTTNTWYNTLATNNVFWLYADLDEFIGIAKYGLAYYAGQGGWMPESVIDQTITVAPNAITAGSSVTVTFTSVPAGWAVNTYLFVRDLANIERVKITVISGLDVTFQTFVASYSAGSKFCLENTTYSSSSGAMSTYYFQIGHDGTKNFTCTPDNININSPTSGDALSGLYPAKKVYLSATTMWVGPFKNQLATLSTLTSETTHTIGAQGYRFFHLHSSRYALIKEV